MNFTRKKWLRFALPVLTVAALSTACGDDDGDMTGFTIDDLAGTWNASSVVLSSPLLGPLDPLDLILAGATVTIQINSNESFTFSATNLPLASPTLTITGSITITGDNTALVSVDPIEAGDTPADATFNLSGNNLSISIPEAELVDLSIPPDGVIDPTDLDAAFTRSS